jgi:hypothetical protein
MLQLVIIFLSSFSLLACGCWGSAAILLKDTSGFSKGPGGRSIFFYLVGSGNGPPCRLLGFVLRASGRCLLPGLGCEWHGVGGCSDAGGLDCVIQPPNWYLAPSAF